MDFEQVGRTVEMAAVTFFLPKLGKGRGGVRYPQC